MSDGQAIANTNCGKVEGFCIDGIRVFKGIPYAAPPVGELRWLPPQPVQSWDGIRPALSYGPISLQAMMSAPSDSPGTPDFGNQVQGEDCLSLNIWTPALDDARRPVLVWIHGGAFIMGSGTEAFLERGNLARRGNMVVVSINYRLGALGFMNLKEITGGKIPATGNEGLLDQVAALEWVRNNIANFGGDPDNVTIGGFSAGGMSVGSLLAMKAARGMFHKAINRSGAANIVSSLENSVSISEQFLNIFGLKGADIEGIRNLTAQQLLEGQQELGDILRRMENQATPFQPVVDGDVFPEPPMAAIRKGSARGIPIMAGNTRDELKAMNSMDPVIGKLDEQGVIDRLSKQLPLQMVQGLVQTYRDSLERSGKWATPSAILGCINTDMMFRIPTIQLVEAQRNNGASAYNYLFVYKSPAAGGILGAMHGLDNPFLFGELNADFTGDGPEVWSLSEKIQDSCAAFTRTGDPSNATTGPWPVYGNDRMTMIFDTDTRIETAPFEEERRAWDGYDVVSATPI